MKHLLKLIPLFLLTVIVCSSQSLIGQSLKEKMKNKLQKDNSEIYECGYVYNPGLKDKLNPMKALQKGLGNGVTDGNNSNLGAAAISVFYQAHLHPQSIMRYPTETPGWETCGDAVFAGFTNRSGIGLSSTDGQFLVNGEEIPYAGIGTFFHGFSPDNRSTKQVKITSSNGNMVEVEVKPGAPLEIVSINGQAKGEEIILDGTEDVTIELANGDADPNSRLHVQLICRLVSTPVIYDVIVTKAKNTIYIPKEAFKNFEGSPSPFSKENTLIVNRVTEKIFDGTDAGAIRTLSAYMDWTPVTMGGDIAKGSIMTSGFDESKNTSIKIELSTQGEYNFTGQKDGPFISPPVKLMKKVAIASFVVRGNLEDKKTETSVQGNYVVTNQMTKWFPELSDATWQKLADQMYGELETKLANEMGLEIVPLNQVVNSAAYKHAKTIQDGATKTFVEVGAGGSKRILTSSSVDFWKDLSITFPGDFVSERIVKELDVDAVLAITFDLNFNFETEGLDPKVSIVAFAPNVSYKTAAKYFSMTAQTQAKSLDESRNYTGGVENVIYQMIKANAFHEGLIKALKELSRQEDQYPVYEALWKAKF